MAAAAILKSVKQQQLSRFSMYSHQIWHTYCKWGPGTSFTTKIHIPQNSRWRRPPHWNSHLRP